MARTSSSPSGSPCASEVSCFRGAPQGLSYHVAQRSHIAVKLFQLFLGFLAGKLADGWLGAVQVPFESGPLDPGAGFLQGLLDSLEPQSHPDPVDDFEDYPFEGDASNTQIEPQEGEEGGSGPDHVHHAAPDEREENAYANFVEIEAYRR